MHGGGLLGEVFLHAVRADAVRDLGLRVVAQELLDHTPVALVVADLAAPRTDGHEAAQGLDVRQGVLELRDELLAVGLDAFAVRDVDARADVVITRLGQG